MYFYTVPFVAAMLSSVIMTLVTAKVATKLKVVDNPGDQRKIHKKPIPLLGGLPVYLSFVGVTFLFWQLGFIEDVKISATNILIIFLGGLILMIGGILDDKYNLAPKKQLIFPLIATIVVIISGIKIQFVTNPLGGVISFPVLLGTTMAFIWMIGMIYTTKLLDGLDGLLSGVTVIGSLIIFAVSLYWDVPFSGTSFMAVILAGSFFGFLFFNWHPAIIFLGEGGSTFAGFMLAILSIISGSKIATALLIMGVPILDVLWVIVRRVYQKASPSVADRKHLHFRLLDLGFSHKGAVLFLYVVTAVFGTTSIFLHSLGKVVALGMLSLFMATLAYLLVFLYKKKYD